MKVDKGEVALSCQDLTPIFEIALPYRGDAYRSIYCVRIGDDIWVVDAFKKKSKQGIMTPHVDMERIRYRLKLLREQLK